MQSSAHNRDAEEIMKDFIQRAITAKRLLRLQYEPGERVVEPHALGLSADGTVFLRAFQVEGESAQGERAGWKLFRLDRVGPSRALAMAGSFSARPEYKKGDRAMKGGIIAEL